MNQISEMKFSRFLFPYSSFLLPNDPFLIYLLFYSTTTE